MRLVIQSDNSLFHWYLYDYASTFSTSWCGSRVMLRRLVVESMVYGILVAIIEHFSWAATSNQARSAQLNEQ